VQVSELCTKQYREILKSLFGDRIDYKLVWYNIKPIILQCTNLSDEDLEHNLSCLDITRIIVKLREISLGTLVKIRFSGSDGRDINVALETSSFYESLDYNDWRWSWETKGVRLEASAPSMHILLEPIPKNLEYLQFLRKIVFRQDVIQINSIKDAEEVFDNMPIPAAKDFVESFKQYCEKAQSHQLIKHPNLEQSFVLFPTVQSIMTVIKILFLESYATHMDYLFYMSHVGRFSIQDLDALSPGEFNYLFNKLEETIQRKRNNGKTIDELIEAAANEDDPDAINEKLTSSFV
jgi:hypothetical protein